MVGLIWFFPPFTFLERGGQLDRESGGLGSPPASPWGSWGNRAKSQPWETRGLQLNHTAKTTNLLLGFSLSLVPHCLPSTNRAQSRLGLLLLPCSLTHHRLQDRSPGSPSAWPGWQGLQLLFFPRPQQLSAAGLPLLLWGGPLGRLTPGLVLLHRYGIHVQ